MQSVIQIKWLYGSKRKSLRCSTSNIVNLCIWNGEKNWGFTIRQVQVQIPVVLGR